MSNTDPTAAILAKLASMEAELTALKAKPSTPTAPQFDMAGFRQSFVADPVGTLTKMGAPVEHITRVLVANAMGDEAPQELRHLAQQGPLINATQNLDAKLEALSRQFSELTANHTREAKRKSIQAFITDKNKYPLLSKAAEADPSLVEEFEAYGGTAEEFATRIESRLALVAPPPARDASAEPTVQSNQDKPATPATSGGVPPIPVPKAGVFTDEDHQKLKAEILHKASQAPQ